MSNMLSTVRLLAVPLENDYKHTLFFENETAQYNYFTGKTIKSIENCSYQRKERLIRFPACIDDLISCNYVMYRNNAHSSKWYYAFIVKMEYKNDEMTEIFIETDVMQTWADKYTVKPSFIEREHVENDTTGLHTYPEQLETGEYVINSKNTNNSLLVRSLIIGCTVNLNSFDDPLFEAGKYASVAGDVYNGIFSGIKYYKVTRDEVKRIIKDLAKYGQSDAIVTIFTCPSLFVTAVYPEDLSYSTDNPVGYAEVETSDSIVSKDWLNTFGVEGKDNVKPVTINGHTVRNNKLFTYPYCYMLMSNNSGGSAVYKYELFHNPEDDTKCKFQIESAITPSFSITITPKNYNNVELNRLEKLALGKFPICAWATDVYTNWLTQNAVNIPLSIGTALVTTGLAIAGAVMAPSTGGASAIATVGAIGAGVGGATSIASTIGEVYQHSLQPPQAEGNINSGDVTFASGSLTFTAYQMTIKREMAEIIDGYFDMFGYKICKVKLPSVNHRKNYWYIKTQDVNIDGNIPMEDLQKIKQCYNNGITFWKNPVNIGDYSVNNECVS